MIEKEVEGEGEFLSDREREYKRVQEGNVRKREREMHKRDTLR